MSGTVVYYPAGAVTGGLPLDRDPHLALAAAVLACGPNPVGLRVADCAQIGLQLTGHARCVAADLRQRFEMLPGDSELRPASLGQGAGPRGRGSRGPVERCCQWLWFVEPA
ncbi:restriction endonuclease [Streptomyces sp. NPDC051657]|uniref:restriction endonuclease n=1 Tax=unclassified Streptomyces TaxID=2593676 RepID=UPI0034159949